MYNLWIPRFDGITKETGLLVGLNNDLKIESCAKYYKYIKTENDGSTRNSYQDR